MRKKANRKRMIYGGIVLIMALVSWGLWVRLPIVTGYAAKEVCSCVFVAGRSAEQSQREDAGAIPMKWATIQVNQETKSVESSIWGFAPQIAAFHPNLGCALVHRVRVGDFQQRQFVRPLTFPTAALPFPLGEQLPDTTPISLDTAVLEQAMDFAMSAKGTRAALVVYNGQIVGERYAEGFDQNSRLLGWSMSKSITNALIGVLVQKGLVRLDQNALFPNWQDEKRKAITLNDLLQMSSGLDWREKYFDLSDATRMLFLSDDMGKMATYSKATAQAGSSWYYSSGTSNLLAEIMERTIDNQRAYWVFPYSELFNKINANSFLLETDASGTFVASSYSWATARDWARLGLLYANDGVWDGNRILPEGWVKYSTTPCPHSGGRYGAQIWLNASQKMFPDCPKDLFTFEGFNGQYVSVIPSKSLVIVRLGLDSIGKLDYNEWVRQVVTAIE